jgi:alkylation response protein AidB-like acyl-CoA dehydrogenase
MTEALLKMRIDTNDYNEFRDPLRALCSGFPPEYWRGLEDNPPDQRYPTEFADAIIDSGFFAALIAEDFGGAALPLRVAAVILETIHSTPCNASCVIGQMYLPTILGKHGSEAQKSEFLPRIASGETRFLAAAISEDESGGDLAAMQTRAEKRGDRWVINGTKHWVNNARHCDVLTAFLVDIPKARENGMSAELIDAMINSNSENLVFNDLELPADAVIGEVGKGYDYYRELAEIECILCAACASGDSGFFSEKAVNYANERIVFGRPISYNQGIQFPISKAYVEVQGAKLIGNKAAAIYDAGKRPGATASMAKHMACEAAWNMADACFTTHGGFAFAREYDVERKWRDVRIMQMAPQGTNMLLADIAENDLGMPRSF